ncbi:MAG: hypothetical protein P0Y56_04595 [Candidatus Andeanibacterium colombiense]|uniref:Uncharacterized protein n=1 Tax=Candidatus Andeanibacterium colombiense TaxID=3121345 RepID=A0AAJ5X834_9SPHN|nr:MAG: hypothetical protein P0Y56_04595 [Sphingomonadaceae bacterium]
MTSDETVRESWQASVTEANLPSMDEVRAGADRLYRKVRLRNRIEYAACTVAVACFGVYVFVLEPVLQKIGSALIVAGTVFAAWQLHRRASAVAPEAAGQMPVLDFARAQLARQRDALLSIFWWYLLPFIPGLAIFMAGTITARPPHSWGQAIGSAIGCAVTVGLFAGLWWLNRRVAAKLQKRIDEIDALRG